MILVKVLVKKLKSQRKLGMLELASPVVSLAFLHLSKSMKNQLTNHIIKWNKLKNQLLDTGTSEVWVHNAPTC
jgi:hypothetical protein